MAACRAMPAPAPSARACAKGGRPSAERGRRRRTTPAAAAEAAPPAELRSEFAETAFWEPHLLTGADGSAAIEFTVPDSVTSWNVWVHAVTRDLRAARCTGRRGASRS